MPHNKTPIRSERIAGLARVVRAAVVPVMEGIPLWHERDISHSSTERVFLPDAAITTDYLLHLTTGLVENLVVDADRMRANLDLTGGLIYTSAVLLELVESGLSREDSYALVQGAAMETWSGGAPLRETRRARAAPARWGGAGRWGRGAAAPRSGRRCARGRPRRGWPSTRPGWTRSAGPRATCANPAPRSTGRAAPGRAPA